MNWRVRLAEIFFEADFGCLAHSQKGLYITCIHAIDGSEVGEVAFLLLRLFGQDVALESVLSFKLAGTGESEALLGG